MKKDHILWMIESYYYLINNAFKTIEYTEKVIWIPALKGNELREERERQLFIANEKWNIRDYLNEIKKWNEKLKALIHES